MLHLVKQVGISVRKFLLVRDGDNLPICLVDIHDHLLVLLLVLGF